MKEQFIFRVRTVGDFRDFIEIPPRTPLDPPMSLKAAVARARTEARKDHVVKVMLYKEGEQENPYYFGNPVYKIHEIHSNLMGKALAEEAQDTRGKIKHEDCGFFRSARAWARQLAEADQGDAEHIAYLEDKLKTVRGILQARERTGKYLPKGGL
jgi:hypothetical protein